MDLFFNIFMTTSFVFMSQQSVSLLHCDCASDQCYTGSVNYAPYRVYRPCLRPLAHRVTNNVLSDSVQGKDREDNWIKVMYMAYCLTENN